MDEKIVKLTGQPVSKEMQDILSRLENDEYVPIDEINATREIQFARTNVDYSRPTIQLPGREELHHNIIQKMSSLGSATFDETGKTQYNESVNRGSRLDIVIGLPASGKSSAIVDVLSEEFHSRVIDNDEAKKMIPQYNNGWGAGVVHEESQTLSDEVFYKAICNHDNIVLPKVGSDANKLMDKYISLALIEGYNINLHYVELSRNKALGRMLNRFIEEGRFLDPALSEKYCNQHEGNKIEHCYETLKQNSAIITGYSKWNNNVKRDEKPILIESHNLDGNYINNAQIERKERSYEQQNEFIRRGNEKLGNDYIRENGNSLDSSDASITSTPQRRESSTNDLPRTSRVHEEVLSSQGITKSASQLSKSFHKHVQELKKNGFQPSKDILKKMQQLDTLSGKYVGLKEIRDIFKDKNSGVSSECKKIANEIGQTLKSQELEHVSYK